MIHRMRRELQSAAFQGRLAGLARGAPASSPVSITVDLGPGREHWLDAGLGPGTGRGGHSWYWARPARDEYRLGLGCALQVSSYGPQRFAALDRAMAGLSSRWRFEAPPMAFLGFAFGEESATPLPNALLAIPAVLLDCRQGRCTATFTGLAGNLSEAIPAWKALLAPGRVPTAAAPPRLRRLPQPLADQAWLARVRAALRDIDARRLEKVVLSRRIHFLAEEALCPAAILLALLERQPESTLYAHGHGEAVFLGASPERLASLRGGYALADALAGTAWEASNPACGPIHGEKNSREQSLVAKAVRAALAPLCRELSPPAAPEILRLGSLSHLRTTIGGPVRKDIGLFDLARALHPTPAVGGSPTPAALDWLHRQGETRGAWYSGGIGCIEPGGDGEIVVALRCALIVGERVELQAGAGIVAGSDPEQELAETEAKLATLLDALQAPRWQERTGT